jgi:PAS domain S-box-containing protein
VIVDPDYRIVGMNVAAEQQYGTTEDATVGRSPASFMELSYLDDTASADVLKALDDRGFWQGPLVHTVHDGRTHLINATLVRTREAGTGRMLTYSFMPLAAAGEELTGALAEATPEGRFRNLFEHLPEALLVQELTGRILEVNQAAAELYGYERWSLPGRHASEITADLDDAVVEERLQHLREHGWLVTASIGRRADGTTFPQRATVTKVALGGRELVFVLARELTEEQRLERGLAALTELGRVHESGDSLEGIAAAAVDVTSRMFEADRAGIAAFGNGDEVEWLAQHGLDRMVEATRGLRPMEIPWLERPLTTGAPLLVDRSAPGRKESSVTDVADALGIRAYAIVPLRSGDELTGALGLVWNRTAPHLAADPELLATVGRLAGMALGNLRLRDSLVRRQRELDESEARYRRLFEEAPQPLLIESLDGRIVDVNAAAARLYGVDRAALIGREATDVAVLDSNDRADVATALAAERRGVFRGIGRRIDGTTFPQEVEIAVVGMRGEDALLVQVRDTTEEQRLRGELLQAQKMEALGQLISGVAHELNNPLSAIIAFSQLMQRDDRLPPDVHRDADLLMQEADRTRRIVQNLLEFARQRPPERRPTNVGELIDRSLELHSYAIGMGRIEVVQHHPDDVPPVDVDPGQILQLLLNLVANAIQSIRGAQPSGTITIEVSTVDAPARVRVAVRDDGPGVPEEIRSRLFEPFFTTREVGQGTGLGLSVSYGIAASHGGRLWFEPAPGRGATFLFELPALSDMPAARPSSVGRSPSRGPATVWAPPPAEDPRSEGTGSSDAGGPDDTSADATADPTISTGSVATEPPLAGARPLGGVVLAVDDEPSIRTMIARILSKAGHDVTVAASGADALVILERLTFDVMLVDHRMSGMDGTEFYERAVAIRPELRDRTVFMSGDTQNPALRGFAELNAIHILAKPFDMDHLRRLVGEMLEPA